MSQTLTEGRLVHFVLAGRCLAAVVARVWPEPDGVTPDLHLTLAVFAYDAAPAPAVVWQTAVPYAPCPRPALPPTAAAQCKGATLQPCPERSWHWPEDHPDIECKQS